MTADPFRIDERTCISFSGGRTSAYMLWRVLQACGGTLPADCEVCFANTGLEDEATLAFVRDCAHHWRVPVRWLEFRNDEPAFVLVDFDSASREGEPFSAIIEKRSYLPNPFARFCTVELKVRTMHRYLKSLGWDDDDDEGWQQMIGIRADEQRRVAKMRGRNYIVKEHMHLPLADAGVTVHDVAAFWKTQPFDLGLGSSNMRTSAGNCVLCFMKPAGMLQSLIEEKPERAVWWIATEQAVKRKALYKGDGARFRLDHPSYEQMATYARTQRRMFDPDEEALSCFCGD